jgi:hypothetical protein
VQQLHLMQQAITFPEHKVQQEEALGWLEKPQLEQGKL